MSMLHIVNKSPFERNALESCLGTAQDGSSVLLIEDGVVCATGGRFADTITQAMKRDMKFYALHPDLKARGFSEQQVSEGVKLVGYDDFVDLVANHDNVQSWL